GTPFRTIRAPFRTLGASFRTIRVPVRTAFAPVLPTPVTPGNGGSTYLRGRSDRIARPVRGSAAALAWTPTAPAAPAATASAAPRLGVRRLLGRLGRARPNQLLEVEERVARGLLLRFLLVAPPPAPERLPAHDDLHQEHLLVIGPVLTRDSVLRVGLELALHVLLQHALVVRQIL